MSNSQTIVEEVDFECVRWDFKEVAPKQFNVQPKPGTWTYMPAEVTLNTGVKGLISCPKCANYHPIPKNAPVQNRGTHGISRDYCVAGDFVCGYCGFLCRAVLKNWDNLKLHCVAYESWEGDDKTGHIKAHKWYCHADNEADALRQFYCVRRPIKITNVIGAALVIGFFADDDNADKGHA